MNKLSTNVSYFKFKMYEILTHKHAQLKINPTP